MGKRHSLRPVCAQPGRHSLKPTLKGYFYANLVGTHGKSYGDNDNDFKLPNVATGEYGGLAKAGVVDRAWKIQMLYWSYK
jgi:hypothetical protein